MEARIETGIAVTQSSVESIIKQIAVKAKCSVTDVNTALAGYSLVDGQLDKPTLLRILDVAGEYGFIPVPRTNIRMKDVAVAAGVSEATVANCLMQAMPYGKYSAETVKRVRGIAEKMGYVPMHVIHRPYIQKPHVAERKSLKAETVKNRMLGLRKQGYSNMEIAHMLGVTRNTVLAHIGHQPASFTAESIRIRDMVRREHNESRKRLAAMMEEAEVQIAVYRAASNEITTLKAQVEEREASAKAALASAQEMRKPYEAKVLQLDAKRMEAQRAAQQLGLTL